MHLRNKEASLPLHEMWQGDSGRLMFMMFNKREKIKEEP
jgi:hypothetical protein